MSCGLSRGGKSRYYLSRSSCGNVGRTAATATSREGLVISRQSDIIVKSVLSGCRNLRVVCDFWGTETQAAAEVGGKQDEDGRFRVKRPRQSSRWGGNVSQGLVQEWEFRWSVRQMGRHIPTLTCSRWLIPIIWGDERRQRPSFAECLELKRNIWAMYHKHPLSIPLILLLGPRGRFKLTLGEGRVHPGPAASPSQGTYRDRQPFMLTFTPTGNLEFN